MSNVENIAQPREIFTSGLGKRGRCPATVAVSTELMALYQNLAGANEVV